MKIYKYALDIEDEQIIESFPFAKALAVQWQGSFLCLWALVDETASKVHRKVYIIGTGNPMPEGVPMDYVGTVQQFGGALIWHVFVERV